MSARQATGERQDADDALVMAAGGVLWRPGEDGSDAPLVAVVHRPKYDDWSLPKGKVDPGEHLLETAVRELLEETGHVVRLGRPLGVTAYLSNGLPKRVHYWSAQAVNGTFSPHAEVDALEWLPVSSARERVHRDADRAVLDEFLRLSVLTEPVVVLRHAKAVSRKSWEGEDELRPLSDEGTAQAQALVGLLRAYAPRRVVSSPSTRCLDTVRPLLAGEPATTLDLHDGLSEPGHEEDADAAPRRLQAVLEDVAAKGGAVVCSHRPVLPALLATLEQATGRDPSPDGAPLRPAEFVVAHVDVTGRVVALERHRP